MSKLRDAVYGFAVGDALGVPYEFRHKGTFTCTGMTGHGTWNQPRGTWSDDTSMLLATCDSIRECGGVNLEDIMGKFAHWYISDGYTARGNRFDVGDTTARALTRYISGVPLDRCGSTTIYENGNGSLMRILPLAFIDCDAETICEVSALTHGHILAKNCCLAYVAAARNLIDGIDPPLRFDETVSRGYVLDTLESAIYCLATTNNYKDCVLKAVNLGGDTDTVAACAGGLAGIKYGYDTIPKSWIRALANKKLIESCLF